MKITAPDGLVYRPCEGGDEAALHSALRTGSRKDPTFCDVIEDLSDQIVVDDALADGYLGLSKGRRILVAVDGARPIGIVVVTLTLRGGGKWKADVDARTCRGACHPERALDFVGDALAWLRGIGVDAAIVRAHVRESHDLFDDTVTVPARVAKWTAYPIPEHPLGLARDLTFTTDE